MLCLFYHNKVVGEGWLKKDLLVGVWGRVWTPSSFVSLLELARPCWPGPVVSRHFWNAWLGAQLPAQWWGEGKGRMGRAIVREAGPERASLAGFLLSGARRHLETSQSSFGTRQKAVAFGSAPYWETKLPFKEELIQISPWDHKSLTDMFKNVQIIAASGVLPTLWRKLGELFGWKEEDSAKIQLQMWTISFLFLSYKRVSEGTNSCFIFLWIFFWRWQGG